MSSLTTFHTDCHKLFDGVKLFPIEVELARSAFQCPQEIEGTQVRDLHYIPPSNLRSTFNSYIAPGLNLPVALVNAPAPVPTLALT